MLKLASIQDAVWPVYGKTASVALLSYDYSTHTRLVPTPEELMRSSTNSGVSLMRTLDPRDDDDMEDLWCLPDKDFSFSTATDIITFKTREHVFGANFPIETWRSAAFIRQEASNPEDEDSLQYNDEFAHHPILWRSFFAFPPISRFRVLFDNPNMALAPSNDDGIILADVLQNIMEMYVLPHLLIIRMMRCSWFVAETSHSICMV